MDHYYQRLNNICNNEERFQKKKGFCGRFAKIKPPGAGNGVVMFGRGFEKFRKISKIFSLRLTFQKNRSLCKGDTNAGMQAFHPM